MDAWELLVQGRLLSYGGAVWVLGVSLISVPGKVMRQLLLGTISKRVKDKKVIWRSQRGFSKRKSCLTNLTTCGEMTGLVDGGSTVDIVSPDSSKVCDSVSP